MCLGAQMCLVCTAISSVTICRWQVPSTSLGNDKLPSEGVLLLHIPHPLMVLRELVIFYLKIFYLKMWIISHFNMQYSSDSLGWTSDHLPSKMTHLIWFYIMVQKGPQIVILMFSFYFQNKSVILEIYYRVFLSAHPKRGRIRTDQQFMPPTLEEGHLSSAGDLRDHLSQWFPRTHY